MNVTNLLPDDTVKFPELLYGLLKIWAWLALRFYCGRIELRYEDNNEPCILACTHPNSFLDAIVMGACMPRSLHFLARGDAFKKPNVAKVLRGMHMIPIFRASEGKENLHKNEETFRISMDVLRRQGCIMIFPEGICVNEFKVRPLKKGTARMAAIAWDDAATQHMVVQPVTINYSSFTGVPKNIKVHFGEKITKDQVEHMRDFNDILHKRMAAGLQTPPQPKGNYAWLLAIPALLGYLTQRWYYVMWKNFARKKTKGTVFYDSVLFCCLMLTYPLFLVIITAILSAVCGPWGLLALILLPFTAWSYKQYRSLHLAQREHPDHPVR